MVIKQQSLTQLFICQRDYYTPAMQQLLNDPDTVIANSEIIKAGNTTTVAKVQLDNKLMVIKRYNIINFWYRLKRALRPSRAIKSFRNAHRLIQHGLATPQPIAILEKRLGPLRGKAYLICQYVEAHHANDFLQQIASTTNVKKQCADAIRQYMQRLANLKIYHGDMKATNWLIGKDNIYLTDLDSMKIINNKRRLQGALNKDRQRFLKNWRDDKSILALFTEK